MIAEGCKVGEAAATAEGQGAGKICEIGSLTRT